MRVCGKCNWIQSEFVVFGSDEKRTLEGMGFLKEGFEKICVECAKEIVDDYPLVFKLDGKTLILNKEKNE